MRQSIQARLKQRKQRADSLQRRAQGPRLSPSRRGYGRRWQKVQAEHLRIEPHCRRCAEYGRIIEARQVDHIIPLARGGAHYDHANLQSLCDSCHSRKIATEDGGFGNKRR